MDLAFDELSEEEAATCRASAASRPDAVVNLLRGKLTPADYRAVLRTAFRVRRDPETELTWTATHELVTRCAFKGVVTTNYDPGIVDARARVRTRTSGLGFATWADEDAMDRWRTGEVFGDDDLPVLYAHGHHNKPEDVVLATNEYHRAYRGKLPGVLRQLIDTGHLVWIGFSFADKAIAAILREVARDSGTGIDPGAAARHVAIMPWDPAATDDGGVGTNDPQILRSMAKNEYGSRLVLYPAPGNDHSALQILLEELTDPRFLPISDSNASNAVAGRPPAASPADATASGGGSAVVKAGGHGHRQAAEPEPGAEPESGPVAPWGHAVQPRVPGRPAGGYPATPDRPSDVEKCDVGPQLGSIVPIDLTGTDDEEEARRRLLEGVAGQVERRPSHGFPGAPVAPGGADAAEAVASPGSVGAGARFPARPRPQDAWRMGGHRRDPHFVGRRDELAAMHRRLRSGVPPAPVQAVCGLAGVGKTKFAVEYAYRHSGAYDLVWWVGSETQTTRVADYSALLGPLGLPAMDDELSAVAAVRQELGRRDHWLLIFDNVEDPAAVERLLPEQHAGHVIATSQDPDWPNADIIPLKPLAPDESVRYLCDRAKTRDEQAAARLADALGHLPLALAQAAAVSQGIGVGEYLNILERDPSRLLDRGKVAGYEATVATTWRIAIDTIERLSKSAADLLRLCAFLAPDSVPLKRVAEACERAGWPTPLSDLLELADAARRIIGSRSLADVGDGLLSMHRLVQAVIRSGLGTAEAMWAQRALDVVDVFDDVEQPSAWGLCEQMLPHAEAATDHAIRLGHDPARAAGLLGRVAAYLLARGRNDQADLLTDRALTAAQATDDANAVIDCQHVRGRALHARGRFVDAHALLEQVYLTRVETLGHRNLATLRAGRDLVQTLFSQGLQREAAGLHGRLLPMFRSELGDEHPETVTAVAYEASLMDAAGEYGAARKLEEQVLEARRRVLGADHPATFTAMGNLAATLHYQGEFARSRALGEEVLKARRRVLGADHPATFTAMGNLAGTLRSRGDVGRARELVEDAQEGFRRVLGPDHPNSIKTSSSLVELLTSQGNLADARKLGTDVLARSRTVFGVRHTTTTGCAWNLALVYRATGNIAGLRTIMIQYLSWLHKAPKGKLTADQWKIRQTMGGMGVSGHGKPVAGRDLRRSAVERMTPP